MDPFKHQSDDKISIFCDKAIVFALCAAIFILPVSIAVLEIFAALAIFFYFFKKINLLLKSWSGATSGLSWQGKMIVMIRGFAPPANPLGGPLQLVVLAFFISVIFSQYHSLSLFAFFGKFIKSLLLYCCFLEAFRSPQRIRLFLIIFFSSALIIILSGVVQHVTGRDFIRGHRIGTENGIPTGRINSVFFSANGLGAYLLPVFGLLSHCLWTAFRRKSWRLTAALALFTALLLSCLCWTYSRSAWVGYLVVLGAMCLLDWRKILYAGVFVFIFIFVFLPSLNSVRHLYLVNDDTQWRTGGQSEVAQQDVSSMIKEGGSGRYAYWQTAFSIIRTSPIVGTGLNTYTRMIRRNPNPHTWWYAHNCYLQLTAETGILGLGAFCWMLIVLFGQGWSVAGQMQNTWILSLLQGTMAGLAGFLVQSFFDNTFYTVQLGIMLWLMMGLLIALTRLMPHTD